MYSGLFECFRKNDWDPTGIPTITKLAEKIAQNNPFKWFIVCKTQQESEIVQNTFAEFSFQNLNISIIPYKGFTSIGRFNNFINDILAFKYIFKFARGKKNIFYCDRSNIIIAALLKTISRVSVVIRILGLYPDQKRLTMKISSKILSPFIFLAYKVPYDLAICTQDGSGIEFYLHRLLNNGTNRKILLNGVKKHETLNPKTNDNKISFLFVGKLIDDKGIIELIDAIYELKKKKTNFILNVVGKGHLEERIRKKIIKENLISHIKLIGSVKHDDIHQYYENADIYISLNKLGNLSNTVLEAMAMNKCIVMLQKDENTHTDMFTEQLIPADTVIRIDKKNIAKELTVKLEEMISNPFNINEYRNRVKKFAGEFLWSWDERIDYEIKLLNQIKN